MARNRVSRTLILGSRSPICLATGGRLRESLEGGGGAPGAAAGVMELTACSLMALCSREIARARKLQIGYVTATSRSGQSQGS